MPRPESKLEQAICFALRDVAELDRAGGASRELALAKTNLEQAEMWAQRALGVAHGNGVAIPAV